MDPYSVSSSSSSEGRTQSAHPSAPALFPSVQPPSRTPFTLYSQTGEPSEDKTVLAAQTDQMEYDSRNHMGTELGHGDGQVAGEAAGHSTQCVLSLSRSSQANPGVNAGT